MFPGEKSPGLIEAVRGCACSRGGPRRFPGEKSPGLIEARLADDDLGDDSDLVSLRQWPYAEFLPIALQFDMLFERVGWLKRT